MMYEIGLTSDAINLLRCQFEDLRDKYTDQDQSSLIAKFYLGVLLSKQEDSGHRSEGQRLLDESFETQRSRLGVDHRDTLQSLHGLTELMETEGCYSELVRTRSELAQAYTRLHGPEDRETLYHRIMLAEAIDRRGDFERAERAYRKVLKDCREFLGNSDGYTALAMCDLAVFLTRRGRFEEALSFHRTALDARQQSEPGDMSLQWSMHSLAETLRCKGEFEESKRLHLKALAQSKNRSGEMSLDYARFLDELGLLFEDMGDSVEAEKHFHRAVEINMERHSGRRHPCTAEANLDLGCYLNRQRRFQEAEVLLQEVLAVFEDFIPKHYNRFVAASALGMALLGQGKFEEAETLLLEGQEGLAEIPYAYYTDEGPAAIERLVRLYELWNKPDEAAIWQAKLETLQEEMLEMQRVVPPTANPPTKGTTPN